MANRFYKPPPKTSEPTKAEVRQAKEFWMDIFHDVIVAQISDDSVTRSGENEIVGFGGRLADRALEEMEKRWGKT